MALHEVQLKGYSVRPCNLSLGTFDSYGIEQLHVTLDDTWSGLAVTATFNPPKGEPVEIRVPENGLIDVPAEATANEGTGAIVYCGVANGVQLITKTQGYNVITHGNVGGTEPFNPSESLATQVLQAALNAEKNSAEANTAAQSAQTAAENATAAAQASAESASKAAAEAAAAKPYAESAKASAEAARDSENQAQQSSAEANTAKNAAQNAQAGAESSATAAAKSAKEAAASAVNLDSAANTATQKAAAASASAAAAKASESAAASSEAAARKYANSAESAAKTAGEAAAAAAKAKTAAESAQADAAASKSAAANSATQANQSANAAANSAAAAKTSEDAAAKSAADADSTANSIKDSMTQIAANKEAVSQLKEDLVDLESETKNIFNPRWLLNATGWARNGNSYTGTAGNLGKAYKENNYPISFEPNTKYTLSLKASTNGSDSTGGYGIQFEFYYTDGTKSTLSLLNNTLSETSYVFGTNAQKSVSYLRIRHSSGGNNTWVLTEIQIEKGNRTNYVNPFTANDIIAREKIEALESNTEIEISEVKSEIDDFAVQSKNLIIAVGIDNIKNKEFHVTTDDGYNAFPFIGTVNNKLVCVYSIGKNHTDNTNVDIFVKTSPNGVIWSKAKKIISTENVRDTITGLGHDSLGIIYFWNRKGTPVNADCSFDLYKTSDGIVFTKKSHPVFDIKPSHIGDALFIPTVGVISFYNTYRANRNSYGYVLTKDGGETWSQIEIANPSTQSDTPTEISGTYIGNGKILALGRSEDSAAMFQIQSSDFGKTWETKITNITDVYLSTPTLIYDDDGYITVYYYNRADGKLKKRKAIASTVFESATSWGEPSNIASGSVGQDAGNANSVIYNNNIIVVYYSGTDTETRVIDVIN